MVLDTEVAAWPIVIQLKFEINYSFCAGENW